MSFSTPYLTYILEAYGLTFFGLVVFLIGSFYQFKKSSQALKDASYEA